MFLVPSGKPIDKNCRLHRLKPKTQLPFDRSGARRSHPLTSQWHLTTNRFCILSLKSQLGQKINKALACKNFFAHRKTLKPFYLHPHSCRKHFIESIYPLLLRKLIPKVLGSSLKPGVDIHKIRVSTAYE